jgi:hypothetical protein
MIGHRLHRVHFARHWLLLPWKRRLRVLVHVAALCKIVAKKMVALLGVIGDISTLTLY